MNILIIREYIHKKREGELLFFRVAEQRKCFFATSCQDINLCLQKQFFKDQVFSKYFFLPISETEKKFPITFGYEQHSLTILHHAISLRVTFPLITNVRVIYRYTFTNDTTIQST